MVPAPKQHALLTRVSSQSSAELTRDRPFKNSIDTELFILKNEFRCLKLAMDLNNGLHPDSPAPDLTTGKKSDTCSQIGTLLLMNEKIKRMTLHGGPCDGDEIEIHEDNLKILPRISTHGRDGKEVVYVLDNKGKFVWLPDPDDPKVQRGIFVCDDNGNVLSEERSLEDAMQRLEDLDDDAP